LTAGIAWPDASDSEQHIRWTRQLWSAIRAFSTGVGYINYLSAVIGAERVKAALGIANYERLVQVKTRYDPTNLFQMNQNIMLTIS
jgi:hypothetical protein